MAELAQRANIGECGCGCGEFGTLKKAWRSNGVQCVQRKCQCKQCQGKGNRARGDGKANKARKVLGLAGPKSRHEEHWRGALRVEVKSGAKAKPVDTQCRLSEAQSAAQTSLGDNRPFAAIFMPDGTSDGWVCFRLSQVEQIASALAEQMGLTA